MSIDGGRAQVVKKKRYVAIVNFDTPIAGAPGPLLFFKKDEFVQRVSRKGDWFFGTNKDNKEGWFPESMVQRSRPQRGDNASMSSDNALMAGVTFSARADDSPPKIVAPPAETAVECIKVVRATCDYNQSTDEKHLKLAEGDVVAVTEENDTFMTGYLLDGRQGIVPSKVVSVIHSLKPGVILGRRVLGGKKGDSAPATLRTAASSKRLVEGGSEATPRNKIVREIIQTEIAYGKHLEEVCTLYRDSLAVVPGEWKKSIPALFQNIDTIRTLSRLLQKRLDEMVAHWKSTSSSVAAPFLELGPFFVAYEQYCRGFEAAQKLLDSFSQDAAFQNFLKATRAELPLPAMLVMPVQRMPRYKLLLTDLLKHTAESHPDYKNLQDALSMVSAIATGINEKIRSSEKTQALLEEGRDKERLAMFVTKERTVLMSVKDATVKIDQAKSMVGKLKADLFILSDSLLLLLRRTVRTDVYGWMDDFSHIFWPTRLLWAKKGALGGVQVGGPLFGITLKMKKQGSEFADLLLKEINKHKGPVADESIRVGVFAFYESGVKYDGEWHGSVAGGFMEGKGKIAMGAGMVYNGSFLHNELTGAGKMKLSSGDMLSGAFDKGILHGEGTIEYPNGDSFKGRFQAGLRCGAGEFRSSTTCYVGEWAADNAHGKGKLTVGSCVYTGTFEDGTFVAGEYLASDGTLYTAQQFVNFNMIDGRGSVRYGDGSVFSGNFKLGIREGEGRHEFPDGSSLQGVWKHDLANGAMVWVGGGAQWLRSYNGTYVDGRPHAKQAEATFGDGSRFVGSFKNGVADKGELTLSDGSVLSGKFRNGQWLSGKSVYTPAEADEVFEGVPDASHRMPAKNRFMHIPLPATRPSFPLNIAQGAMPHSASGSLSPPGSGNNTARNSSGNSARSPTARK